MPIQIVCLRGDDLTAVFAKTLTALCLALPLFAILGHAPASAQTAPIYSAAIPFDFADHEIKSTARSLLDGVAVRLLGNANQAHITGFADDSLQTGEEDRRLALRRAVAVRTYLLEKGVTENRMRVFARGDAGQDNIGVRITIHSAP